MKKIFLLLFIGVFISSFAQTVKSKILKLKYTAADNWTATEFGGPNNWEESGNALCKCSGFSFTKPNKEGKMNIVVYASTASGLDSNKRNFIGNLHFEDVDKYEKTTNKHFSFQKKRSNFTDTKTKAKSFEVIRYQTKFEDHYYIIYVWQESMNILNPAREKEFNEMFNSIEAL